LFNAPFIKFALFPRKFGSGSLPIILHQMNRLTSDHTLFKAIFFTICSLACVEGKLNGQLMSELQIKNARCNGLSGSIKVMHVIGGQVPYYFSLDSTHYSTNPNINHLNAGDYRLFVRDDFGHFGITNFSISQPDELKVSLTSSKLEVYPEELFELNISVTPDDAVIEDIKWRPTQHFTENQNRSNTVNILRSTTFAVEVRDTAQCVAYAQIDVKVPDSEIYFPNVISAKSTSNEIFTMYGGSQVDKIKMLRIVDRYGRTVFFKKNLFPNDTSEGWDGKSKDKPVGSGVYFYECEVEYFSGKSEVFSGDITVIN
jgi:gliding motility-associated-like protein